LNCFKVNMIPKSGWQHPPCGPRLLHMYCIEVLHVSTTVVVGLPGPREVLEELGARADGGEPETGGIESEFKKLD
jgi:hypothetical protein